MLLTLLNKKTKKGKRVEDVEFVCLQPNFEIQSIQPTHFCNPYLFLAAKQSPSYFYSKYKNAKHDNNPLNRFVPLQASTVIAVGNLANHAPPPPLSL